jgi:phosphopantetheinyl transferase (holo-ACP synthase)
MIGDDIVDLGDPETRAGAEHPGFDARVFAPSELAALARSRDRRTLRWILWSAKEATYKAAKRRAPGTVFSPRRFVVTFTGRTTGRVAHGADRYDLTLDVDAERVHAIARVPGRPGVLLAAVGVAGAGGAATPPEASAAVRALAAERVARALGLAPASLAVERDGRLPRLAHGSRTISAELSLSHHGRFVSFACLLDLIPEAAESAA